MASLLSSTGLYSAFKDALPYSATAIAAVCGYFAARYTAAAPQQMAWNDAFRIFVTELQEERANLLSALERGSARITELESEIIRQRGNINAGLAREAALLRLLEKNGIGGDAAELH